MIEGDQAFIAPKQTKPPVQSKNLGALITKINSFGL